MKRPIAVLLLLLITATLCSETFARDQTNTQTRAYRKSARKAQKDMVRYSKQQQKAMKKSAKAQRKALKRAHQNHF
ncbi:MAG TPA: hypothetical protein VLL05_11000 [Terriglobales bacterium]|nr:hypothetical protein [Terriglobales bacterium]